jgi:hypothetical protein
VNANVIFDQTKWYINRDVNVTTKIKTAHHVTFDNLVFKTILEYFQMLVTQVFCPHGELGVETFHLLGIIGETKLKRKLFIILSSKTPTC